MKTIIKRHCRKHLLLILLFPFFLFECSNPQKDTTEVKENISESENAELKIDICYYEALDYNAAKEILSEIDNENAEKIKYDYLANDSVKASWEIKRHPLTSKVFMIDPPAIAGTGTQQSTSVFLGSVLVNDTTIINEFFKAKKHNDIRPFWKATGASAVFALITAKSKAFTQSALSEIAYDNFEIDGFSQLITKIDSSSAATLKSYFGPKSYLITKINLNEEYELVLETSYKIYDYKKSFGMVNIDNKVLKSLSEKHKALIKQYVPDF